MGGRGSLVEQAIAVLAFNPPQCEYGNKDMKHIKTIRGDNICVSMDAPFSVMHREEICSIEKYSGTKKCILYSHGNSEDMQDIKSFSTWLADNLDANVITWDPVGYGRSTQGTPTEKNMQEAIEAVYDYATSKLSVPQDRMILMGRSIGTAPTVYLASRAYCHAQSVVLLSPLASGFRTVFNPATVGARVCKLMDPIFCPSITYIKNVRAPVCIVHGRKDTIVPIHNAVELYEATNTCYRFEPLFIDGAGHNDVITTHQQTLLMYLETFLAHSQNQTHSNEGYT